MVDKVSNFSFPYPTDKKWGKEFNTPYKTVLIMYHFVTFITLEKNCTKRKNQYTLLLLYTECQL